MVTDNVAAELMKGPDYCGYNDVNKYTLLVENMADIFKTRQISARINITSKVFISIIYQLLNIVSISK